MAIKNLNKFKLQKKHLAFFTIVPLLAVTAIIQTPCPVCHGSGHVSSTGMDEVNITNMTSSEVSVFQFGCDTYTIFRQYEITLTLENHADHDAGGYININLFDYRTGQKLDSQFVVVEVPAHISVEHTSTVYFMTRAADRPEVFEMMADILHNNVNCKACDGTGKVALNSYFLSRNLKDTLFASQRIETPAPPPPLYIDTEAQPGDF